jgi:hypothetical protein
MLFFFTELNGILLLNDPKAVIINIHYSCHYHFVAEPLFCFNLTKTLLLT